MKPEQSPSASVKQSVSRCGTKVTDKSEVNPVVRVEFNLSSRLQDQISDVKTPKREKRQPARFAARRSVVSALQFPPMASCCLLR